MAWNLTESLNRFTALDGPHRMAAFAYLLGAMDQNSKNAALGETPSSPEHMVDLALRYAESAPVAWAEAPQEVTCDAR